MNQRLKTSWDWFRRFMPWPTLLCIGAVAFIIFSGENTVFRSIEYDEEIDSLNRALAAERDTMLYYKGLNARLASDAELMEQVVREQYGMKRASEDVYLFE